MTDLPLCAGCELRPRHPDFQDLCRECGEEEIDDRDVYYDDSWRFDITKY